jgi:1,4-dihydroxy-6-naphthoate synthase
MCLDAALRAGGCISGWPPGRETLMADLDLTFGFSPCPNDTFAFHALAHGQVAALGVAITPFLADVEELNRRATGGELEMSKLSFHALGLLLDRYLLLRSGAALGRGCGPIVVVRPGNEGLDLKRARVAVPGRMTTAHMLLSLYLGAPPVVENMVFSEVMEAVAAGRCEAGLVIHEGRFTYERLGLRQVLDLGQWWEAETGLPIPLGCIALRRDVAERVGRRSALALEAALAASVARAWEDPQASQAYVLAHAQEMEPAVVASHIGLYVNEFTRDLGEEGLAAVQEMLARGRRAGMLPAAGPPLTL